MKNSSKRTNQYKIKLLILVRSNSLLGLVMKIRGSEGYAGASMKGGAGVAIAPPYFGRIEGAARQRRRAALLCTCPPSLRKLLRPLLMIALLLLDDCLVTAW